MIELMSLGIARNSSRPLLNDKEKQFIRDNRNEMSAKQIGKHLRRDPSAIYAYLGNLDGANKKITKVSERWDDAVQGEQLKKLVAAQNPMAEIAAQMGFGVKTIRAKCQELGIERPPRKIMKEASF